MREWSQKKKMRPWRWRLLLVGFTQIVASSLWLTVQLRTAHSEDRRGRDETRERPVSVNDIAFGILTAERYLDTRLHAQQLTWVRHVRHVVFYTEHSVSTRSTVVVEPKAHEQLVGSGAWKDLPALRDLYWRFPLLTWFVMTDDDTYVFVPNLAILLDKYAATGEHYIGRHAAPSSLLHPPSSILPSRTPKKIRACTEEWARTRARARSSQRLPPTPRHGEARCGRSLCIGRCRVCHIEGAHGQAEPHRRAVH